jgi:glutamate synthase domain-containing protein 3
MTNAINTQSEMHLKLGTKHFKEANEEVRQCLEQTDTLVLEDVFAQRYLGCAMPDGKRIEVYGTPGNDMACYMDGGSIEVYGNAQDQIGNTMNAGSVVIHGRCGDAAGYAMRGGEIYVRDDCGWRVGIHMKQYEDKKPLIVIGGNAGSFLGEYMAGGTIVLLGHHGQYLASGMHGGVIYMANEPEGIDEKSGLCVEQLDEGDMQVLVPILEKYNTLFAQDLQKSIDTTAKGFVKLIPLSSRPYGGMYTN